MITLPSERGVVQNTTACHTSRNLSQSSRWVFGRLGTCCGIFERIRNAFSPTTVKIVSFKHPEESGRKGMYVSVVRKTTGGRWVMDNAHRAVKFELNIFDVTFTYAKTRLKSIIHFPLSNYSNGLISHNASFYMRTQGEVECFN